MANIKSADRSTEKWARQSAASTPEYEAGVQNPRSDWATQTKAAEKNYATGVQAAISRGAFGRGVAKAGTAGWKEATLTKGTARWAAGISMSTQKYADGFEPYRKVIEGLNLPARGPKGDPANINRVSVVAKALHDKKLAIQSGK